MLTPLELIGIWVLAFAVLLITVPWVIEGMVWYYGKVEKYFENRREKNGR